MAEVAAAIRSALDEIERGRPSRPVLALNSHQLLRLLGGVRRQARADLLEELVDEIITQAGDIRDRLALALLLVPSDHWPPLDYARTLYRRAKEERHGR